MLLPLFQTTSAQIPMLEFRNHINEVLRYYADNGVTWQISGWYKPGIRANDEQGCEPTFYVTSVTLNRVLEDAPLFNIQVQDNGRQILEAAIQRPCHQRVPAATPTTKSSSSSTSAYSAACPSTTTATSGHRGSRRTASTTTRVTST